MSNKKPRKMNAARVCFGISRIGYTPASAICDIIDNAVSANATEINVKIIPKNEKFNKNKKNNIEEYLIIDNGKGMDISAIENALDLGSNDFFYTPDTLSKFGLGLKSASFAQGKRLEVISGDGNSIHKEYVDLDEIGEEYFSVEEELNEKDKELIEKYFTNKNRGTIIRISKIYTNNHPSINTTLEELKEKIGVIYYYFLKDRLNIYINDEEIEAFDPLFVQEAGNNNLDENEWDGKTVQWISKPDEIMIDPEAKINGKIEITMLPHPRVSKIEGISDKIIRDKYHINANNYGFYVYRNDRLINWANRLDIIPQDQDYYAFRGRINIHSDADDAFNIDISKSHISLSQEAKDTLDDYIASYKNKCKNAWNNAYKKFQSMLSQNSNDISNKIADDAGDYLNSVFEESNDPNYYDELKNRENQIIEQSRKKVVEDTLTRINDEQNSNKTEKDITEEDIKTTIKGGKEVSELNNIFKVQNITDNILWEPYMDAEKRESVRISKTHRYSKLIYENNHSNTDLQVLIELLLFISAKAEFEITTKIQDVNFDKITKIFEEYRLSVSDKLARLCRKEEDNLPPHLGDKL